MRWRRSVKELVFLSALAGVEGVNAFCWYHNCIKVVADRDYNGLVD